MDRYTGSDPVRRRLRRLTNGERVEEARGFIRDFAQETGLSPHAMATRTREVTRALQVSGYYSHTPEELAFGARVAWRNHARCIGRLFWKSLEVIDCRLLTSPEQVAVQMFSHMEQALDGGNLQPLISIFAPLTPFSVPVTVESTQVMQFAGYTTPDGNILGDIQNVETTRTAKSLGWEPPKIPGQFDLLPIILRDGSGHRYIFELPKAITRLVPIEHPQHTAVGELGLKWYPVPCVSNMILTIGGVDYPCAPFSGFYMVTEIASRNLADSRRYDSMEPFARAVGLDPSADPLWRDGVLTEMNRAVLHSFRNAGIRLTDHHEASDQFMEFHKREQREGREVSANWTWIISPQAGSACPVFHLPMTDLNAVPNFYTSRHLDGGGLRLYRGREPRSRLNRSYHWWLDHWRDWRRQRDSVWQRH